MRLRFVAEPATAGEPPRGAAARAIRVGYAPPAFPPGGPAASLVALFPQVRFEALPKAWSAATGAVDLVIAAADASDPDEIDSVCTVLAEIAGGDRTIVFLDHADVQTTRRLIRAGAADVLPAPISEPALAASLERLLARREAVADQPGRSAQVMTFMKAGGGVGATSVAAQLAVILAERGLRVCLADLDVQAGAAAMYLDLQDAVTLDDVLAAGRGIGEVTFATALAAHASGARILAAPRHFLTLDSVSADSVDALMAALRRDFDVVLVDLPPVWTDWTHRILRQADKVVLVTELSVPHAHLVRRQLHLLQAQGLDDIPVMLVCNRAGGDGPSGVSVRSVERAVGRGFNAVLPEDAKLMREAINQGVALRSLRRGSKLEKALNDLAQQLCPDAAKAERPGRWRR